MLPFIRSNNSINPEESYKTIDNYGFDKDALCMFIQNYEVVKELKQENRNGTHFNKVGPNVNVTGKGCYYVPYWSNIARRGYRNARNLFYKYCAYHLFYGKMEEYKTDNTDNFINFAQYLPKISPLCLDFDIVAEFKKSDRDKFKRGDSIHIYTDDHIYKIVEILNNIIFDNFDIEKEDIKAYVFEKESFKFKSEEEVKDGIHIIYLQPFNVKQRWFIRQELINKLKEIDFINSFEFKVINDYNDIVDEAVITRNPWLTYGSVKVESKTVKDIDGNTVYYTNKKGEKKKQVKFNRSTAYTLSYIFDFELFDENIDCVGNKLTYETIDDMEAMLNLFDLDQFSDDDPLEEKSDKLIKYKIDEKIKTVSNNQINTIDTYNTNDFTIINNKKTEKKYDIRKLTPKILQNIIKDLVIYVINYNYNDWFMICCGIRNCTLICFNGDETKAKNYVHYFCKKDKRFSEDNFDDDYEKIKSESFKYQGKQCNIRTLMEHIYDSNKVNEYDKDLLKDKINNRSNMDSSDSYTKKEISNTKKLNDVNLFEELKKIEKYYYEEQKKKLKDDNNKINILKESDYPFDKKFKSIQETINNCHITSKRIVENLLCQYIEQYIKKILKKDYFYCYEIKTGDYEIISNIYLKNCIPDKATFLMYDDYEELKNETFNPLKIFSKYSELNGYNEINKLDYDNNLYKPRAYEEIYYVNGCEVKEKIFNNGPIIPKYLVDNYIPYNKYDEKYKDFVQNFFKLVRIGLCSNKQEEYEYLKNWIINKILLKRNETIVVLQSKCQGCGKSTVTLLFQEILGSRYVTSSNDCSWLYSTFNSVLENKVVYCIEETTQTKSSNEWFNASGKLKDFITNPNILITHKFHDTIECNNYIDFIVTSNNYNTMPLETENRRYFIPNVLKSKNEEIEKLTNDINSILKGKEHGEFKTRQEKEKYYRCFFAYCNENYNKDFRPSNIPITDAIIDNNEIRMPFELKYIKVFHLYKKLDLDNKRTFKIVFNSLKYKIKEFYDKLNGNEKMIEKYNYCQNSLNIFNHDTIKKGGIIMKEIKAIIKNSLKLDEKYFVSKIKTKGYDGYPGIVISYDELLEKYREYGYIDNLEYKKLKGNYDELEYCDNIDYSYSNLSYSCQLEELEQQLKCKNNLINGYKDELKEKDRIIEQLESFKDEYKDKEIEKLKSYNNDLNTINTSLNTKISELENSNNDLNKIIAELKAKINKLEKLPIVNNKKIEIENLKKECKLALDNKHTIHELRKLYNRCKKLGFEEKIDDKDTIEYKMKELEILLAKFIEIKI